MLPDYATIDDCMNLGVPRGVLESRVVALEGNISFFSRWADAKFTNHGAPYTSTAAVPKFIRNVVARRSVASVLRFAGIAGFDSIIDELSEIIRDVEAMATNGVPLRDDAAGPPAQQAAVSIVAGSADGNREPIT